MSHKITKLVTVGTLILGKMNIKKNVTRDRNGHFILVKMVKK